MSWSQTLLSFFAFIVFFILIAVLIVKLLRAMEDKTADMQMVRILKEHPDICVAIKDMSKPRAVNADDIKSIKNKTVKFLVTLLITLAAAIVVLAFMSKMSMLSFVVLMLGYAILAVILVLFDIFRFKVLYNEDSTYVIKALVHSKLRTRRRSSITAFYYDFSNHTYETVVFWEVMGSKLAVKPGDIVEIAVVDNGDRLKYISYI